MEKETIKLLKIFEGSGEGDISWYLGSSFSMKNNEVVLSQKAYIESVLIQSDMTNAKTVSIPMASSFFADIRSVIARKTVEGMQYRNLLGALIYLSNRTRPDIATSVSILAQFQDSPNDFLAVARYVF